MVEEMKAKNSREKHELLEGQRIATEEIESLQTRLSTVTQQCQLKDVNHAEAEAKADKINRKLERKLGAATRKILETQKLQEETQQRLEDVCTAVRTKSESCASE